MEDPSDTLVVGETPAALNHAATQGAALIAGMIPVALGIGEGAEFRAPLGRAVIGGVTTSTLLTLVVIPTFYEVLDEWREWVFRKFGVYKPRTAEHPIPRAARATASGEKLEKLA